MKRSSPLDLAIAALFIAGGIAIAAMASSHELLPGTVVGPGLFPLITGIGMALFGSVLALQAWRGPVGEEAEPEDVGEPSSRPPLLNGFALGVVAIIAAAALLMPTLGFMLTGILASVCVIRLSGGRWMPALVFSPVATLTLFYIFVHAFGVPLPRGIVG